MVTSDEVIAAGRKIWLLSFFGFLLNIKGIQT